MSVRKTVLMAELSDYRYDARVLKQAQSLAKAGYEVTLVMYNTSTNKKQKIRTNNLSIISFPFSNKYLSSGVFNKTFRLISFIKLVFQYCYTILPNRALFYHGHNYYVAWILYLSCRLHKGKFIFDQHEIFWEDKNIASKMGVRVEKYLNLKANLLISPSDDRANLLNNYYGSKYRLVLNNYPSVNDHGKSIENNILSEQLYLGTNKKIILFTGLLSIKTRLQHKVIESLRLLPEEIVFVIIGFGHDHEIQYLKKIANENKVNHRVYYLGPIPNKILNKYILCCDIGICLLSDDNIAHHYHALNKFYDYVSCGLAILTSDFPTFQKEINLNPVGRIGKTCNQNDPQSIAQALLDMTNDDKILDSYKLNSKTLFKNYWNWEVSENKLIHEYKNLLEF